MDNTDYQEIACQQILDQIHTYLYHSYHCGFMLTSKDIIQILQIDDSNDDIISGKTTKIRAIQSRLKKYKNESGCNILLEPTLQSESKEDVQMDTSNEIPVHDFGTRFGYYGDWEGVSIPKYSNLQQEILQCDLFSFSKNEWNIINIKAKFHLNKKIYKLQCRLDTSSHCNIYQEGQLITIQHLHALLMYINYGEIKYHLGETYTKLYLSEPDTKRLERHSIFSNLGRLLQEAVNVFGFSNTKENTSWGVSKLKYIYYGLNQVKSFYFMLGAFRRHGPMTQHRNLVSALNSYKGIVLKTEYIASGRHFWSEYLSDFTAKQEILLMGRYHNSFNFRTIINILDGVGVDYYPYIAALNIIESFTRHGWGVMIENTGTSDIDHKIHSIVVDLFNYAINGSREKEKYLYEYPEYINCLWRLHLTRSIIIIPVNETQGNFWFLEKLLYEKKVGMIKLDVLLKIFKNTKRLELKGCAPTDSKMQYVYDFLSELSTKTTMRMTDDDQFSFMIGYFCRIYGVELGNDVIDLLYQYFGNARLQRIRFDRFSNSENKKYKEKFISKWNTKFNNISWEVTGSDDVTIKYKHINDSSYYNCVDFLHMGL